jgi:ubiquinone/menaquinone biosynthesis C-methylase UbiE
MVKDMHSISVYKMVKLDIYMTRHKDLYNLIGKDYNTTRKADPLICKRLITLLSPGKSGSYIDIGCGTGNYTTALSEAGFEFTGLDPSETMLATATQNASSKHWLLGSAERIPAPDGQFDGAIATLTIHHWTDIKKAFQEIHRVLKINSRLVLFTSLPEQMAEYWLNHYFPQMMQTSIKKMPGLDQITDAGRRAGFHLQCTELYNIRLDLEDHFLYSGKMNPELYLDDYFRKGMSSFAEVNLQSETEAGLKILSSDIASGRIKKIQEKFQTNGGDYIFIVLKKKSMA